MRGYLLVVSTFAFAEWTVIAILCAAGVSVLR